MKFTLPINWREGWREVEAEIVDVAPHLSGVGTFALHKQPEDGFRGGDWSVTNLETGLHVYTGRSSSDAIRGARSILSDKTVWHMRRSYRKALKNYPQLYREAFPR